jgi:hypothetical protein
MLLHCEWLNAAFLLAVKIFPAPLPRFIKNDIAGDNDVLYDSVVAMICFGPGLIADEDYLATPAIEFSQVWPSVLDVHDAAEGAEVVDRWNLPVLGFEWCLAFEHSRWLLVENVHHRHHNLTPEVVGQSLRLEHASHHGDHTLIPLFHHPILLWRIRCGELMVDTMLCTVFTKLHGGEFPYVIRAHHLQILASLHLDGSLKALDLLWCLILARKQS